MSLYLCVVAEGDEVAGVDVGGYGDFNAFRRTVVDELERGCAGSQFPTLIRHSDCDGEWSVEACARLQRELEAIAAAMKVLPPVNFPAEWQKNTARALGLEPRNAFESFIDVDGACLVERLLSLAGIALSRKQPILFQ